MESKLKQRLTGALVLASLAVIILPWLLDGAEEERARIIAGLPDPPKIDLADITVQDVEQKMEQMARASAAQLPVEVVDETDYETMPDFTLDKNQLPVNWSLQVGSFQNRQNAIRLRGRLREENYRAYILRSKMDEAYIYRVLVGPSSSKETLAEMGRAIEGKLQLKWHIVRYRIEEDQEQLGG